MIAKIRYWVEDADNLFSFVNEKHRQKYVSECGIELKSQLCENGLILFETKTIFSGTIDKYEKIKK